jgi:hypothetical protein
MCICNLFDFVSYGGKRECVVVSSCWKFSCFGKLFSVVVEKSFPFWKTKTGYKGNEFSKYANIFSATFF